MASIQLTELRPAGSELFNDGESFLNDLNDQEMSGLVTGAGSVGISGWGWGHHGGWFNSSSSSGSSGSFGSSSSSSSSSSSGGWSSGSSSSSGWSGH
jgi:hypothetical protein